MNLKRVVFTAAAVGAVLGLGGAGIASASTARTQATNACSSSCTDISFAVPGHKYVIKSFEGLNTANNVISVRPGANNLQAEDFTPEQTGHVFPTYCDATGQPQAGSPFSFNQCQLLHNSVFWFAPTWQLAFNPNNGGPEDMCVGTWDNQNPGVNYKVRLSACGETPATIQILASKLPGGQIAQNGYVWIVNGASNNYSNPLVMTDANTTDYQVAHWSHAVFNGGAAVDTQMARGVPGPF